MRLSQAVRRTKTGEIEHLAHNVGFLEALYAEDWDPDTTHFEQQWRSASQAIQESLNHISDVVEAQLKADGYRARTEQTIERLEEAERRHWFSQETGRNIIAFWRMRDQLNHASLTVLPEQVREMIPPACSVIRQFLAEIE